MLKACAAIALATVVLVSPVTGQEIPTGVAADSLQRLDLPEEVADEVIAAFNDPLWLRLLGSATIAEGDTIRADVAVLQGPLELGGHIAGDLLVVNGDVRFLPGASVSGGVRVVGGTIHSLDAARIGGEVVVYPERLRYRRDGERIVRVRPAGTVEDPISGVVWGRSDFLIATGDSYNRVEGLPITFGPRIRTAGSNPLRLHALAIYRTESGVRLDTDDLGYYVRAEQFLGGRRSMRIGATAHSQVTPIEDWQISDLESGISTFLLHRDFRDQFERQGISFFGTWEPPGTPYSFTGEIRRDRHRSLEPGSPWSLFRNAEPWRAEPLVGEGRLTSVRLSGAYDTRNDPISPAAGWYLQGRIEQSVSGTLTTPELFVEDPLMPTDPILLASAGETFGRFSTGLVDIRRYNRVDPRSRLNFRFLAGGSLDGGPLPPQYQHALGGEGSLPGYDLFGLDCAARSGHVFRTADAVNDPDAAPYFARYGCDAFALLQAEFRGRFNFRLRWDSAPWLDDTDEVGDFDDRPAWEFAPDWTVFVDAGRAWRMGNDPDEDLAVDVGVGLVLGRLGAFLAIPLTGSGGINAFVRLGPRF